MSSQACVKWLDLIELIDGQHRHWYCWTEWRDWFTVWMDFVELTLMNCWTERMSLHLDGRSGRSYNTPGMLLYLLFLISLLASDYDDGDDDGLDWSEGGRQGDNAGHDGYDEAADRRVRGRVEDAWAGMLATMPQLRDVNLRACAGVRHDVLADLQATFPHVRLSF